MEKKVVIVLLIIAILLSVFSLVIIAASQSVEVGEPEVITEGYRSSGEVGLTIAPPTGAGE